MKRRNFLKNITAGVAIPSLVNGFGVRAFATNPYASLLGDLSVDTDHVLVVIQLEGGNDGLNTVVPLDQYDNLFKGRSNVIVAENDLLPLTNATTLGMHPAFSGVQQLYNAGQVRIVQNVGYPNPSLSHFRATDIWMSGSDADEFFPNGWAGRYLAYEYPNYPTGYPNTDMPHPLAVEIGSSMSLAFMGPQTGMGFVIPNTGDFYNLLAGVQDPAPNTPAGEQLAYVRQIAQQSRLYAQSIVDASNAVPNQKTYPDTPLAAKLKVISRLIAGGLKTRLYMVSIGGFDTHDQQVDPNNHSLGIHANLLRELGDAIKSFTDDLAFLGTADRVVGMTFSEFGRRITSNFSMGTDHGEAAPLFLFGKPVAGGVTGANPAIPPNPSVLDNLNMEFDFRSVYASVLRDWFCVPQEDVGDILLHDFPFLNLFQAGVPCLSTAVHDAHQAAGRSLLRLWPNPVRGQVTFEYDTAGGMTQLQVLDQNGRIVATPVSSWQPKGQYQESWDASGLASGTYYCRLVNERQMQSKMLVKVE